MGRVEVSSDSGLWVDVTLFLVVFIWIAIWLIWKKVIRHFQDFPLDHYLGSHDYCSIRLCPKRKPKRVNEYNQVLRTYNTPITRGQSRGKSQR